MDKKYFFVPRKGIYYTEGLLGSRTLIVGAYHVCDLKCPFSDICESDTVLMDKKCPVYEGKDEYYRLSNSNVIEIDSYVASEEKYPSYSEFTKFMLSKKDYVSDSEKEDFWNRVAFYNYAQNYRRTYRPFDDVKDREKLDRDFYAFKSVIEELRPEVIYVWHDSIRDVIDRHIDEIDGLRYVAETSMQSLTVHCYTILNSPVRRCYDFYLYLNKMKTYEKIETIRKAITLCKDARQFNFSALNKEIDFVGKIGFALLLEKDFEVFLYNRLIFSYFDNKNIEILNDILQTLYYNGFLRNKKFFIFRELNPDDKHLRPFIHKYKRSGLMCYIIDKMNLNKIPKYPNENKPKTWKDFKFSERDFVYGLGYCDDINKWKDLKKEYKDYEEDGKRICFDIIMRQLKENCSKTRK